MVSLLSILLLEIIWICYHGHSTPLASYESQQRIQLKLFADYFGREFASTSATQFPWMKLFRESSLGDMVDIPISHVSKAVYRTSIEWLNQRSYEALGSFVLRSLNIILSDIDRSQKTGKKSKEVVQQPPKSRVAIFVVLTMVLRQKPEVLNILLPVMKEDPKYQGQDKLPLLIWLIAQACQGYLTVGLFMWVHLLLPMLSSSNSHSRDLILKLVERILSAPKARYILLNVVVWKGERVVPPWALELLMRITFPEDSARVETTERFEAVYPTLKEVALAGSPDSKAMKQITPQILQFALKAAGEGIPELSKEASNIFIWCLTQNQDCYKQWDNLYSDNIQASGVVLRKLNDEWKMHNVKKSSLQYVKNTLNSFRQKNKKALTIMEDDQACASFMDAEKYRILISRRLSSSSWGCGCCKSLVYVAVAVGAAVFMLQRI
ncbi:uncharacterized protein LOC132286800 isoform X2 [Cornus florida]|uniref:uncharacterized protein LOC132286800 isoform X2 n=1 Tax=Cornus florida TaxID=4283 RepID=UPI00289D0462|nr:uncharacterized protein LOC132286800 isoform X2 [Cornus florida]